MDDHHVKNRLVNRETVFPSSLPSTSNIAKSFVALHNEAPATVTQAYNTFIKEISLFDIEIRKLQRLAQFAQVEKDSFQEIDNQTAKEIDVAQKRIEALKESLEEEKLKRSRKEECEMLAISVNKETSRAILSEEISQTQKELAQLKEKQEQVRERFELRQKQYQLLLHSIVELNELLEQEDL